MNQPTFTTLRTDTIQCPGCDTIQHAQVVQVEGAPFASFVHECKACGYIILESEWDVVDALALATKLVKILALVDSGYARRWPVCARRKTGCVIIISGLLMFCMRSKSPC